MDNEYIRMCRAATELQEAWQPKIGDMVSDKDYGVELETYEIVTKDRFIQPKNGDKPYYIPVYLSGDVWLPWQEDIQQLYKKRCKVAYDGDVYLVFNDWVKKSLKHCDLSFNEMWLCFYMETCHNKTWDTRNGVWKVK